MAAILNARTGYRNGTTSGWAARSLFSVGTDLYAVVLDTSTVRIRVYKGTGDGVWTEMDSANAPLHTNATYSYDAAMQLPGGTDSAGIFVAYRPFASSVRVRRFNTATDTWDTTDVGGATATSTALTSAGLALAAQSDGQFILHYLYSSTPDWRYVYYNGSIWGSVRTWSLNQTILDSLITGDSNTIYGYAGGASIHCGHIDDAGADGTRQQLDFTDTLFASRGGYVNDGGTHRIAFLSRDTSGEADVFYATSQAVPSFTTVDSISPTSTTDPGIMGGAIAAYSGKWHAVWSGDGRGEIHYAASDDYVSPAFGANVTIKSGLSATDPAVYAVAAPTGVPVLYTDLTSPPAVDIVWAEGEPYNAPTTYTRTLPATISITVPQVLRPIVDDSIGGWVNNGGDTTNLYLSINEVNPSEAEYIKSSEDPVNDVVRFKLDSSAVDPAVSDGHIFEYLIGKSGAGQVDLTVRLVQGAATEIASWVHTDITVGPTPVSQTLTGPQADAITDYTDLYIEFMADSA